MPPTSKERVAKLHIGTIRCRDAIRPIATSSRRISRAKRAADIVGHFCYGGVNLIGTPPGRTTAVDYRTTQPTGTKATPQTKTEKRQQHTPPTRSALKPIPTVDFTATTYRPVIDSPNPPSMPLDSSQSQKNTKLSILNNSESSSHKPFEAQHAPARLKTLQARLNPLRQPEGTDAHHKPAKQP